MAAPLRRQRARLDPFALARSIENWTHVRKLLGYVRYDSPAAQAAIQTLYRGDLRLFANFVLPSVRRDGLTGVIETPDETVTGGHCRLRWDRVASFEY